MEKAIIKKLMSLIKNQGQQIFWRKNGTHKEKVIKKLKRANLSPDKINIYIY